MSRIARLACIAALLAALAPAPARAAERGTVLRSRSAPAGSPASTTRSAPPSAACCATIRRHVRSTARPRARLARWAMSVLVAAGRMPLGLAQSDTLYDAVTGTGGFAGRSPDNRVRALFSPVVETFLVLTAARNWVPQIGDLRGRRINIGAPASGTEVAFRRMMAARGWSPADFADAVGHPRVAAGAGALRRPGRRGGVRRRQSGAGDPGCRLHLRCALRPARTRRSPAP